MVISFGNPFFYNEYFEAVHVYFNAYTYVQAILKATAAALYGEIPFKGQSPIKLSVEKLKTAVNIE
jgi:hypothetical protein